MAIKKEQLVKAGTSKQFETMKDSLIRSSKELVDVANLSFGQATDIEIKSLVPFSKHTYDLIEDKVVEYAESIKDYGLFTPIIVWDKKDSISGKYEILAGHHRVEACKRLGKETIPAIIKSGISEEEAIAIANQTNMMQRSFEMLSTYEKASSIVQMKEAREKLEQKNPNIKRVEGQSKEKASGTRAIGREFGVAKDAISVYLTLFKNFTKKQFEYMEDTAERKKYFDTNTGIVLCKLPKNVLKELFKFIDETKVVKKINKKQASELVNIYNTNGEITEKDYNNVLVYTQISKKESKPISFSREMLKDFFDESDTDEEIMQEIIYLLKEKKGMN